MCSERDSPLKRLYRRTHAKLTRLAGSGQLVWAHGCEFSLALVHARRPAWPGETSETILRVAPHRKTRPPDHTRVNWSVDASASGSAQVGSGGRHRWAARVQVGREPARQKAREGYPSHYTSLVSCIIMSDHAARFQIMGDKFMNVLLCHIMIPLSLKLFQETPRSFLVSTRYGKSFVSYRKISNISRTLIGNKTVDHWDVVGAPPFGAAPTTSSFLTYHLASMDSAKTAARQYENLLSVGIWCACIRDLTVVESWFPASFIAIFYAVWCCDGTWLYI